MQMSLTAVPFSTYSLNSLHTQDAPVLQHKTTCGEPCTLSINVRVLSQARASDVHGSACNAVQSQRCKATNKTRRFGAMSEATGRTWEGRALLCRWGHCMGRESSPLEE